MYITGVIIDIKLRILNQNYEGNTRDYCQSRVPKALYSLQTPRIYEYGNEEERWGWDFPKPRSKWHTWGSSGRFGIWCTSGIRWLRGSRGTSISWCGALSWTGTRSTSNSRKLGKSDRRRWRSENSIHILLHTQIMQRWALKNNVSKTRNTNQKCVSNNPTWGAGSWRDIGTLCEIEDST